MAALQCDICGGKLVGKLGGLFECEYCGIQYDTAWAKAKIQEIRGTVQVEGTVQVAGTVKVEGGVSAESLLKRGTFALEEHNWNNATDYFDKVLDIDPENAHAYIGKLMAELRVSNIKSLADQAKSFDGKNNYQKAIRFADSSLRNSLEGYLVIIKQREEEQRTLREKREEEDRIAREKHEEAERIALQKQYEEQMIQQKAREERIRRWKAWECAGLCRRCGGNFKGLFSKICVDCGKPKDY